MNFVRLRCWESVSTRPWLRLGGAGDLKKGIYVRCFPGGVIGWSGAGEKPGDDLLRSYSSAGIDWLRVLECSSGDVCLVDVLLWLVTVRFRGRFLGASVPSRVGFVCAEVCVDTGLQSSVLDEVCPRLPNSQKPPSPRCRRPFKNGQYRAFAEVPIRSGEEMRS